MSKVIYVAGPISKGPIHANVRQAFAAGLALLRAGLSPLVPHGSCFWGAKALTHHRWRDETVRHDGEDVLIRHGEAVEAYEPEVLSDGIPYEAWLRMSIDLVRRCDAVLRLPGESAGADAECAEATRRGLPVFLSVPDVIEWAERMALPPRATRAGR